MSQEQTQQSSDKTISSIQAVSPGQQQNPDCQDATSMPSVIKDGQSNNQDQSQQGLQTFDPNMQSIHEQQQQIRESQQYHDSLILDPERKSKLELQVQKLQQQIDNIQENIYGTDVNTDEMQYFKKVKDQSKELVQLKKRYDELKNNYNGIKQSHRQLQTRDLVNFTLILLSSLICTVLLIMTGLNMQ